MTPEQNTYDPLTFAIALCVGLGILWQFRRITGVLDRMYKPSRHPLLRLFQRNWELQRKMHKVMFSIWLGLLCGALLFSGVIGLLRISYPAWMR